MLTFCPALTSILVTSPEAPKLSSTFCAGSSVPLPETVDWTTPLPLVAVRSVAAELLDEPLPSEVTASATSATATIARPHSSGRRGRGRRLRRVGFFTHRIVHAAAEREVTKPWALPESRGPVAET